jgi:NADH:ubiquinone oxidoreductase subunit 4 (subunit M)
LINTPISISENQGKAIVNPPVVAVYLTDNLPTPLTANFIGEFLSLSGAFSINPIITSLAGVSLILSAGYSFWLFNRISFATESPYLRNVYDLTRREFMVLFPLFLLFLFLV